MPILELIEHVTKTRVCVCKFADLQTQIRLQVTNLVTPLDHSELKAFNDPMLSEFYQNPVSLSLYRQASSGISCFELVSAEESIELRVELDEWINDLSAEESHELLPKWIEHAAVIGVIPYTPLYFLARADGGNDFAIYMFDHDGFTFEKSAESFEVFLQNLLLPSKEVVALFNSAVRFHNEVNARQLIPLYFENE